MLLGGGSGRSRRIPANWSSASVFVRIEHLWAVYFKRNYWFRALWTLLEDLDFGAKISLFASLILTFDVNFDWTCQRSELDCLGVHSGPWNFIGCTTYGQWQCCRLVCYLVLPQFHMLRACLVGALRIFCLAWCIPETCLGVFWLASWVFPSLAWPGTGTRCLITSLAPATDLGRLDQAAGVS